MWISEECRGAHRSRDVEVVVAKKVGAVVGSLRGPTEALLSARDLVVCI